jgi:hypothetical protein
MDSRFLKWNTNILDGDIHVLDTQSGNPTLLKVDGTQRDLNGYTSPTFGSVHVDIDTCENVMIKRLKLSHKI